VTRLRRLAAPLRLARARLGRRLGRAALVGLGLAAAAATLAAVLAGGLIAEDKSVGRSLDAIPAPERAVRAAWFGVPGEADAGFAELDRRARAALAPVEAGAPQKVMLFRRSSIGGALVDLGAVDGLGRWVTLRSGRLPQTCVPARCEVLRIRGDGPLPRSAGVNVVEVGRASLDSDVLFGRFVEPGTYHQPATPPLLVAEGIETLASAPSLASLYRSYAWVVPLGGGALRAWETDGFESRVARARSELQAANPSFDLEAPTGEVRTAAATADAAGTRLLLIGGEACALLVAFALLAAASLRRDTEAARRRLTWFGARRWQLEAETGAEAAAIAVCGTLAGWIAGLGIAALVADRAGEPVGAVVRESVVSPRGLAAGALLALVSAVVLFLAVRARPVRLGGFALTPLDVAALGALAVIAISLGRGATDANALAREGGTGTLLLLLPGLVAFVAAVACARALGPGLRLLERAARGRSVPLRLAALSLARRPGAAAIAIGFLTVSLGLALFAETYRSTLARGQTDQAAFAVPADAVVDEDLRQLVAPLEAAPLADYEELGRATPVFRLPGSVSRLSTSRGVTVLGLPPEEIARVGGWRGDFSGRTRTELAAAVDPGRPSALAGPRLPAGADEVRLPASVEGTSVGLTLTLQGPDGRFAHLDLGKLARGERRTLAAPIPPEARGGIVVGLTFSPPFRIEEPGASAGRGVRGVLHVGKLRAGGARTGWDGWIPTNPNISAVVAGAETDFHFALSNTLQARFRPRQASDAGPVPVLATPRLAAAADAQGRLPVNLGRSQIVVRVVGTVERFPSVDGDALVADRDLLVTAANAAAPGTAEANEIWLESDDPAALAAALERPPFDALAVTTRAALATRLHADPLARAALLTLAAAALVALGLALVGLLLGVVTDLRDDAGELFDLEAQGAAPATLRAQVRLRAGIVAAVGLVGGLATGAVLAALVVDLVRVTAGAARAEPPLLLAVDWPVVALAVAAYALLAAALVGLAAARAFRSPVPGRVSEAAA
jgi:hypothetical protein